MNDDDVSDKTFSANNNENVTNAVANIPASIWLFAFILDNIWRILNKEFGKYVR